MDCPRCDVRMKCDCRACTSRSENASKPGVLQKTNYKKDTISCGNCGLTAHVDEWEDLSYEIFAEERRQTAVSA